MLRSRDQLTFYEVSRQSADFSSLRFKAKYIWQCKHLFCKDCACIMIFYDDIYFKFIK